MKVLFENSREIYIISILIPKLLDKIILFIFFHPQFLKLEVLLYMIIVCVTQRMD